MPRDTKERILEAALTIFSREGYAATNLKEIADAVGVVKSAFYRHYPSKEAVWNAVLDRMEGYYNERFASPEHLPGIPQSCDELFAFTMRMVDFTIHDEKIILTRKLLLTEQYHDERVKKLATEHFLNGTKAIYKRVFEQMIENGLLIPGDAEMLAFAFTAPITTLIHYCDREPEREPEIMRQIEAFVRHFIESYGETENEHRNP